jgi:hypothetical protein
MGKDNGKSQRQQPPPSPINSQQPTPHNQEPTTTNDSNTHQPTVSTRQPTVGNAQQQTTTTKIIHILQRK